MNVQNRRKGSPRYVSLDSISRVVIAEDGPAPAFARGILRPAPQLLCVAGKIASLSMSISHRYPVYVAHLERCKCKAICFSGHKFVNNEPHRYLWISIMLLYFTRNCLAHNVHSLSPICSAARPMHTLVVSTAVDSIRPGSTPMFLLAESLQTAQMLSNKARELRTHDRHEPDMNITWNFSPQSRRNATDEQGWASIALKSIATRRYMVYVLGKLNNFGTRRPQRDVLLQ